MSELVGNLAAGLAPVMQVLDNLLVIHNNLHDEIQAVRHDIHAIPLILRLDNGRTVLFRRVRSRQGVHEDIQGVRDEVLESVDELRVEMRKYATHGIKAYNGPRGDADQPFEIVPFPSGQFPEDLGAAEHYNYIPLVTFAAIDTLNMAQARRYLQRYGAEDIPPTLPARKQLLANLIGSQGYRVVLHSL
ncbi:hypothetical protein OF83DRAFT_1173415 [Amylostereum chailletii]|nr:hypothetical protein OF83DRAFT_1173415 [Amylostereum chailletii]